MGAFRRFRKSCSAIAWRAQLGHFRWRVPMIGRVLWKRLSARPPAMVAGVSLVCLSVLPFVCSLDRLPVCFVCLFVCLSVCPQFSKLYVPASFLWLVSPVRGTIFKHQHGLSDDVGRFQAPSGGGLWEPWWVILGALASDDVGRLSDDRRTIEGSHRTTLAKQNGHLEDIWQRKTVPGTDFLPYMLCLGGVSLAK